MTGSGGKLAAETGSSFCCLSGVKITRYKVSHTKERSRIGRFDRGFLDSLLSQSPAKSSHCLNLCSFVCGFREESCLSVEAVS